MDLHNIYSPASSADRVKVIKQQSNLPGRRFSKGFRKSREDKKKKQKEHTLIVSEDINASATVQDKGHRKKDHEEHEDGSGSYNGGVIDIKI
jgi:hypothetical protein